MKKKIISLTLMSFFVSLYASDVDSSKLDELLKKIEKSQPTNNTVSNTSDEDLNKLKKQIETSNEKIEMLSNDLKTITQNNENKQKEQKNDENDPSKKLLKVQSENNLLEAEAEVGKYKEENLLSRLNLIINYYENKKIERLFIYDNNYTKITKCKNNECINFVKIDENILKESILKYEEKISVFDNKINYLKEMKNIRPFKMLYELIEKEETSSKNESSSSSTSNTINPNEIKTFVTIGNNSLYNGKRIIVEENYIEIK